MQKHIIWGNRNLKLEDWKEYFEEQGITEEEKQYEAMYSLNSDYLEDERINLKNCTNKKILAIGKIGRWNGRFQGYKIYKDFPSILYTDCDYVEWYADRYNIKATMTHHDGTNYILYREIKDGVNIQRLCDKIYNGEEITSSLLNYYTKSLRPSVAKIYGW